MPKDLPISLNITFFGDKPKAIIESCPNMYRAVWNYCSGIADCNVKVHMQEQLSDRPLEWSMSISTPAGLKSVRVIQRLNSPIAFEAG